MREYYGEDDIDYLLKIFEDKLASGEIGTYVGDNTNLVVIYCERDAGSGRKKVYEYRDISEEGITDYIKARAIAGFLVKGVITE